MSKSPVYIGAGSQELAVTSAQNIIDNAAEISIQHQEVVDIGATYHGAQTATPTSSVLDGHMWFDTNTGVNLLKFYNADTTTWEQAKLSDSNQTQVNTITLGKDGTTSTSGTNLNIVQVDVVADNIADVSAVADIDTEVTTVAGISSNVTTVAGISANTTTVAGISANVTTVAGISSNITTVAADGTDIGLVAGSITDVNNFADLYQIDDFSPSAPTKDGGGVDALAKGDLAFDRTANTLRVYNGTAWSSGVNTTDGVIVKQEYTGNGSTKHYVLAHDQDMEIVYLNGIKLLAGDGSNNNDYFSVSGGSSTTYVGDGNVATHIYFHTAPATDFVISIVAWGASSNSLAVAKTGGTFTGTLNIGSDGTGQDVIFYGDTAGSKMTWDQSEDALILTDSTPIHIGDNADLKIHHDGSHSYIENAVGSLKIATEDSGIAVSIGHTTSETTINDNLTVTGDLTVSGATTTLTTAAIALFDKNIEIGAVGTPTDSTADGGGLTLKGATDKTITWTNSLDSWVYNQGITVGEDGTGYDVKFFGGASGEYMHWDKSENNLILEGQEPHLGIGTSTPLFPLDILVNEPDATDYTEMIHMYAGSGNHEGAYIGFATGTGTSRIGAARDPLGASDAGTDLRFETMYTPRTSPGGDGVNYTFTIDHSANEITTTNGDHGLIIGDDETDSDKYDTLDFTTTGTLPGGLTAGITYYVLTTSADNKMTISTTEGGTVLDLTDAAGSGTNYLRRRSGRRWRMVVGSNGYVGIADNITRVLVDTGWPAERLDVTGTVKAEAFKSTGGMTVDGATVFNEAGLDVDFRIESLNKDHIFFVDASVDRIGIGTSVCEDGILTVASDESNKTFLTGNQINFSKDGISYIDQEGTGGSIKFRTDGGQDRITIDNPITIHVDTTVSATLTATAFAGPLTGNADTATTATNVTAVANNSTNETVYPTFIDGATGTQGIETDTGLTYNPSTGLLTAAGFAGPLTGNVTGDASGTAATVTGATQASITTLANITALTVNCQDAGSGIVLKGDNTTAKLRYKLGSFVWGLNTLDPGAGSDYNICIGDYTQQDCSGGQLNIAIGHQALTDNITGISNVAVGYQAGETAKGDYNTCLGTQAGEGLTTGDNNLLLGNEAGDADSPSGLVDIESNVICLGNDATMSFYCTDDSISTSDERDKADVVDFTIGLEWVEALRPITYKWDKRSWYVEKNEEGDIISRGTPDGTHKRNKQNIGFLAQEVLAIEQAHGFSNDKNDMLTVNLNEDDTGYGLKYARLVPVLVNAIKELSAKVTALENA